MIQKAIGVLLVAAAVGVQTLMMDTGEKVAPLTHKGKVKEIVQTERFAVRVDQIDAARSLKIVSKTETQQVKTDHIFLVARVVTVTVKRPMLLNVASLHTKDGLSYQASDKYHESLASYSKKSQPGYWRREDYVFEVPASALAGAVISISPPGDVLLYGSQMMPEAEIDLGLSEATAKALIAKAREDVEVKGT